MPERDRCYSLLVSQRLTGKIFIGVQLDFFFCHHLHRAVTIRNEGSFGDGLRRVT
jgi:hypothetical protein